MPHKDFYRNGQKLVSVTELGKIISQSRFDPKRKRTEDGLTIWRRDLCQCPICYSNNKHEYNGLHLAQGVCGHILADTIGKEAADKGNKTHEYVELWLKGIFTNPDEWGVRIVDKIVEMGISKCLLDPEQSIVDEESGLAGSPDFIGTSVSEGMFIGDLKIKNSLDALTGLQGAGYRYLIRRKYNTDISKMLILWAQKKTVGQTVKAVVIPLDPWTEPFKALVTLWNIQFPKRKVVLHE